MQKLERKETSQVQEQFKLWQQFLCISLSLIHTYSVFHQFRQAKFAYGGSILSFSQFLPLTQWALKTTLAIKVVKSDL
jgi:hypothetical protein